MKNSLEPVCARDAARIAEQRIVKRDLTLPAQPNIEKLDLYVRWLFKFHFCFAICGLLLFSFVPQAGVLTGRILSPIARFVFWVYPQYVVEQHFSGSFGAQFYESVVAESFLVAAAIFFTYFVIYVARYWGRPWRFAEFLMEQLGTRGGLLSSIFVLAGSLIVSLLCGLGLYAFIMPQVVSVHPSDIKLFQFFLWSILLQGAIFGFSLSFLLAMSSLLAVLRRIINVFGPQSIFRRK